MHPDVKKESFRQLFQHPEVLEFARRVITEGYVACAPDHEHAMRALLERTFETLEATSHNENAFQEAVVSLVEVVFKKHDPTFWFNQVYKGYKSQFKPKRRFENLRPWLRGEAVLDLGCGDGLLSLILSQHGYQVSMTDVLDYRDPRACSLPFLPMVRPSSIPYPDASFDMALVFAVLHHVEVQDLLSLLSELRRVSQRVIVEEDVYLLSPDLPGLDECLVKDPDLASFVDLPAETQLRFLMFIDYFANAITQGLPEMDMPFNFKTLIEWQALFGEHGFWVTETRLMGFQPGFFNRSCHVWFLLDKEEK